MKTIKLFLIASFCCFFFSTSSVFASEETNVGIGFSTTTTKSTQKKDNVLPLTTGRITKSSVESSGVLPKTGELKNSQFTWMGIACFTFCYWLLLYLRFRREGSQNE